LKSDIEDILAAHGQAERDALIPVLQEIQERLGYLSPDAIHQVGQHLGLSESKIYGVATFYNQFRFRPLGRYHVQICRGTACHVKGSARLLEALEIALEIKAGDTTRDGLFSLEVVACIGACGLAPVIVVDGNFHAKVKPGDIRKILDGYRKKAEQENDEAA
jgi:NADH-quinone oxidoreductase subunit E